MRITASLLSISLLALAIGHLMIGISSAQDFSANRKPARRETRLRRRWHTSCNFTHFGPVRISPIYQIVAAIDDDTRYASTFLDRATQPVILTIPVTTATYSVLTLDPYGNIFESGIQPQPPGTYALTGPDFTGTLPAGVIPIAMPLNFTSLIFRVDTFAASGKD